MDQDTVRTIVETFRQALGRHGIREPEIVLFGSHATGHAREGSDIDLAVISDDFAGKDYWERIDVLSDSIYEVFEPIEAIAFTREEWERRDSFIAEVAHDGVRL